MAKERVDFGGLRGEALALHLDIVQLRQDCVALKSEVLGTGNVGTAAFRAQRNEVKALAGSLGGVGKNLSSHLNIQRLMRAAVHETAIAFRELTEGAIAFNAAKESAFDPNSFNNLLSTLKGGLERALGVGGEELFGSIKSLLDSLGTLVRSDSFIGAITLLDRGFASAVNQANQLVKTLNPDGMLEIANLIGQTVSTIASVVGPVIQGLVAGFSDIAKIMRAISASFGQRIFGDDFPLIVSALTRILTLVIGLAVPLAAVVASFGAIPVSVFLALAAIGVFASGIISVKDEATGVELKFGSIRDIIANGLVFGIEVVVQKMKALLFAAKQVIAVIRGDDAGAIEANKSLERANSLVSDLTKAYQENRKEIVKNNDAAESFGEAFSKAAQKATESIVEMIHEDLPELKEALKTVSEDPLKINVDASRIGGSGGGGGGGGGGVGGGGGGGVTAGGSKPTNRTVLDVLNDLDGLAGELSKTQGPLYAVAQSFANVFGEAIMDALDPNRTKVPFKKRWSDFFKNIGAVFLNALVNGRQDGKAFFPWAIGSPGMGFADGGAVALGGRPTGLAASDTVPAWLTPGEWVMKRAAVAKYGPRIMALLNAEMIDPALVHALSGNRYARMPRSASGGYAAGGAVSVPASAPTIQVLPVLVADARQAEQLMSAGGGSAFLETLAKNKAGAKTILGGR